MEKSLWEGTGRNRGRETSLMSLKSPCRRSRWSVPDGDPKSEVGLTG